MMTGLLYHRPEDVVDFLRQALDKAKGKDYKTLLEWDAFIGEAKEVR
jgi:hypothetical protein